VFDAGQMILYRELWNGAVMTAMPLRIVADTLERTVLYLAPDTPFRAARASGGGPVRDLDDWVPTETVWAGGSLIRLLESGAWHCVDVEFDAGGGFCGWYINFQEPVRRTPAGFDTVDLVLDLVVTPDGTGRRKDEEDFARAVAQGHIAADVAARVLAEVERMEAAVATGGAPFDERDWTVWRPPDGWKSPGTTGVW